MDGTLPRKIKFGKDGFPVTIADFYRSYCKFMRRRPQSDGWSTGLNEILKEHGHESYTDIDSVEFRRIYTVLKREHKLNKILN